jgi:glyoxylate reductase
MPTILGDSLPPGLTEMLPVDYLVVPWTESPDAATAETVSGIVTYGHPTIDGPLLDRFGNVRVVSNHGVGVDHIDVAAATARNIPVGNTPGCLDQATADMTMALLLAAARNVVIGDRFARSAAFTHYDPSILIGHEVSGSTLGIIGLGRIGKQVARRARAFDMRVLYHNRKPDPAAETELGVEYASLFEILTASDFITLNCPLTEETRHLIGAAEFDQMKPTAVLINMARGGVVDTDALCEALQQKKISAAAIDVSDPEPLPRDHPLLALENVVITPHLGSASDRTRRRMMQMTVENLTAGMDGKPLPYRVT